MIRLEFRLPQIGSANTWMFVRGSVCAFRGDKLIFRAEDDYCDNNEPGYLYMFYFQEKYVIDLKNRLVNKVKKEFPGEPVFHVNPFHELNK